MRRAPTGQSSFRAAAWRSVAAVVLASVMVASPASAQLGALKKMAAEKAKEAAAKAAAGSGKSSESAKDSIAKPSTKDSTTKPATSPAAASPAAPVATPAKTTKPAAEAPPKEVSLTPESIDMVLSGIDAIMNSPRYQFVSRHAAFEACAQATMKKGTSGTPAQRKASEAAMKQMEGMQERLPSVMNDQRKSAALMDSINTTMMSSLALSAGGNCGAPPYMSAVVLDEVVKSSDEIYDIPPGARGTLTRIQFGRLREELALWILTQSGTLKPGQVKFTADARAALTARAEKLKPYAKYLKGERLLEQPWSDLRNW